MIAGLSARPKQLSPKYFYDEAGAQLFEEITRLPEYYPTRTELAILERHAAEMAKLIPADAALIEFGSAARARKARLLLKEPRRPSAAYVAGRHLGRRCLAAGGGASCGATIPRLTVLPVEADFTKPFRLPPGLGGRRAVFFFPGSTIGNFTPAEGRGLPRDDARRRSGRAVR